MEAAGGAGWRVDERVDEKVAGGGKMKEPGGGGGSSGR